MPRENRFWKFYCCNVYFWRPYWMQMTPRALRTLASAACMVLMGSWPQPRGQLSAHTHQYNRFWLPSLKPQVSMRLTHGVIPGTTAHAYGIPTSCRLQKLWRVWTPGYTFGFSYSSACYRKMWCFLLRLAIKCVQYIIISSSKQAASLIEGKLHNTTRGCANWRSHRIVEARSSFGRVVYLSAARLMRPLGRRCCWQTECRLMNVS